VLLLSECIVINRALECVVVLFVCSVGEGLNIFLIRYLTMCSHSHSQLLLLFSKNKVTHYLPTIPMATRSEIVYNKSVPEYCKEKGKITKK